MISLEIMFIIIYSIIVIAIGYFSRKMKGSEGFLMANRKVSIVGTTLSTFATLITESIVFFAIALTTVYGPGGVIAAMLGPSAALITMTFFVKEARNKSSSNKYIGIGEHCKTEWGNTIGRLARILFMIFLWWVIILQINLNSNLLAGILNWDIITSIAVTAGIVTLYLLMGGYNAVIKTDIFQSMFLLIVIALPLFMIRAPNLAIIGEVNFLSINNLLLFLMSFFLTITRPEVWQRIYSASSDGIAKKSMLYSAGLHMIFGIFILYYAFAVIQAAPGMSSMQAFSTGYKIVLTPLIAALFPTILLAAMMSSLDSAAFLLSADLSKFKKNRVLWTKIFLILTMISASIISSTIFNTLSFAYKMDGILALLAIPVLISFWKKIPMKLLMFGIIAGLIIYTIQIFLGRIDINSSEAVIPAIVSGTIIFIGSFAMKK